MQKNCYYCKESNKIFLKSSNKNNNKKYNFASTEVNTFEGEKKPDLYFCRKCNLIYSEFIDRKFENNYLDVLDQIYIDQIENKKKYFNNLIKRIFNTIEKKNDVLEIGSYYGAFGSQIKNLVNNYTGLELSSHAANYARKEFKLNIQNKKINDFFKTNQKKFDIIFMFDVIEHLDDPDLILNLCSKNLKKNGRLIFTTMNMDSLFAKITGKYYPWIIPMHKFYFTDNSLKKYLIKNDIKIYKIIPDVRKVSLEYLLLKISQKIYFFKYIHKLISKSKFLKKLSIKFSLFDLNIYSAIKNWLILN